MMTQCKKTCNFCGTSGGGGSRGGSSRGGAKPVAGKSTTGGINNKKRPGDPANKSTARLRTGELYFYSARFFSLKG